MSYVAENPDAWLIPEQSVGDGQCVAFVEAAASTPRTSAWKRGAMVKANLGLKRGTAIATFDADGTYGNHRDGRSHAAIYLGQDAHGIQVMDQWKSTLKDKSGKITGYKIQIVHVRTIRFWHKGHATPNNDGNAFSVID